MSLTLLDIFPEHSPHSVRFGPQINPNTQTLNIAIPIKLSFSLQSRIKYKKINQFPYIYNKVLAGLSKHKHNSERDRVRRGPVPLEHLLQLHPYILGLIAEMLLLQVLEDEGDSGGGCEVVSRPIGGADESAAVSHHVFVMVDASEGNFILIRCRRYYETFLKYIMKIKHCHGKPGSRL